MILPCNEFFRGGIEVGLFYIIYVESINTTFCFKAQSMDSSQKP